MSGVVPEGWKETNLGSLGKYINGKAFKPSDWETSGIPIIRIQNLNDSTKDFNYTTTEHEEKYKIQNGDLLMAWSASLGVYFWNNGEAWLNQHIFKVEEKPEIVLRSFLYYILQNSIDDFYSKSHGTGMVHITKPVFESHKISLPPLPEQHRLVTKLDALFGSLEQLKSRLNTIPQLLKTFRQAVLTQAVTGKLTREWREGKELEEWEEIEMGNICKSITDGDHQAPPQTSEGIPFLVISNVSKGYFDFDSVTRFVSNEYFSKLSQSRIPKQGDILYTVTGSYGISLLVDFDREFCFQRHIAILKPNNDLVDSKFLTFYLNSLEVINQAHNVATGTAQKTVPLKGIRGFIISLPPLPEQHEIVRRVEGLLSKADAIEARYRALKAQVDALPQAVLGKAFRGELR